MFTNLFSGSQFSTLCASKGWDWRMRNCPTSSGLARKQLRGSMRNRLEAEKLPGEVQGKASLVDVQLQKILGGGYEQGKGYMM